MRTLLVLFATVILVSISSAQSKIDEKRGYYRTYQLPDGAVLKGRIIGKLSRDSVLIETPDGSVHHLSKAQARKSGRNINPSSTSVARTDIEKSEVVEESVPVLPVRHQPLFAQGSSQFSADLSTHFSSGGASENSDPESGIVASVSYLYGVIPQLKVGGGAGLMTIKSGSRERVFPLFARAEYQIRPRISAMLSAGYSIIPTNEFVLNSKNGMFSHANLSFDLVGPESAYTSRVGFGLVMQQIDLGRTEIISESGFGNPRTYTQYVERSGLLKRLQITFTHAWRMPAQQVSKRKKRKRD